MKKILFLLMSLGYFTVYAQNFQWSNHIGSETAYNGYYEQVLATQFDEEGNNYMLISFASGTNPKIGDRAINLPEDYMKPFLLLAKFDCSGLLQWYRTIVSYNYELSWILPVGPVYGIMAMHNDKIVCACTSDGNRMYVRDEEGNDTLFTQNMYPSGNVQGWFDLIVQFDNAGNLTWGHCCEISVTEDIYRAVFPIPQGILYDEEGNIHELIYLEAVFDDNIRYYDVYFCGHLLVENIELYVRKYSPEGVLLTVTPVPVSRKILNSGRGFFYFQGQYLLGGSANITTSPPGYLMVNGDTVWLTGTPWLSAACMAAIDTSGQFLWFKQIGEEAGVNGIDMDNAGDIYLAGQFWGRFGNDTIELIWGQNLLKPATSFAKIDHTNGDVLYLKSILTSNNGGIGAIQVMDNQLVALGASVGGAKVCFDSITYLNSVSRYCPYIAIFDEAAMQFICVDRIDTNDTSPHGGSGISKIAVDKDNNLMVCGGFSSDPITIGDSTYHNFGDGADIWIGRYGWACGEQAQWPTGIAEPLPPTAALENRLLLYPNPTRNQLKIENYELQEGDKVEIYNMLGQLQSSMLPAQPSTIEVGHLPTGMYILRVGRMVGKFVKE
jgi:hypothetical protein